MPFRTEGPTSDVHISRRAGAALMASFGLLLVAAVAAVVLSYRARVAEEWVFHTIAVREDARALLQAAFEAQTGVRGYLLSDDPAFLDSYARAEAAVPVLLDSLRAKTADNADQAAAIEELAVEIGRLLERYRRMIALAEGGDRAGAIALVREGVVREMMAAVETDADRFSAAELGLLTVRQAAADRLGFWALTLLFAALAGAMLLAALLTRWILHYVRQLVRQSAALEEESRRRRESEATLVQVQKMEAVGALAGGIAHDFNNMLTIVIGNLDTLRRRLSKSEELSGPSSTLLRPVDFALQGARSAAQLTHRLLAFSRRQALDPVQVDLNRVVSDMAGMIRRTIGENIRLETVLAAGLWPAFADVNQIESALVNLVVNARDAMPNGGHITVETANAHLDEAYAARFGDVTAGQYVLLSVSDTGTGIPPALLGRILEPFFTTKPEGEGSGLGLSMVHGFVKQSGGHLRLYSEIDQGTTVKIYLPRFLAAEAVNGVPVERRRSEPIASPGGGEGRTVLHVEDNDGVRAYAVGALRDAGFVVLEASSADEARAIVAGGAAFDLLFTDVVLGGGSNGRQLADEIRQARPDLPVLYTTGYTRNAIVHAGRLDPGVDLLEKPFTQADLARRISALLDRGRDAEAARAPGE
jgi:signal transduction histidine kinase/ActR/RegA family two-component response regulator